MNQSEMIVNFEVYEGGKNFCGVSQATLPNIQFITQSVSGAGIGGNVDAVARGMVNAMSANLQFKSPTSDAPALFNPDIHQITLMAADQGWDSGKNMQIIAGDKFVLSAMPKNLNLGNLAPAATPDTQIEYSVYYFAGFRDGKKLFEIDPYNMKCVVGGKDYMAEVRKAVGK